ncbi:bifunctional UDP-N-acetylmuramoyl-tripeptide:D-alanyl-D-alanine ligase/alanine racemase [Carboxylicivirga sp. N1Y90]|uniref:bifunctional UDP-N-acetylmuramoyl-tripeptide:D-alanyl-D-alanine ligase/alanine racemase n=1 Tax=Carboxylicivirga fragile TaxID=3417571 RepID=UPI003D34A189|nr:bifunctional UDP-N-acetylmuramoyl-tripeptide:D-alanyl-D-alanine ligase/alanine racemase [Marinilabiliaceae bacterium N1Y90]
MIRMTVEQLTSFAEGLLVGNASLHVERLLFDSRKIVECESTLFLAIRTSAHDGHFHIDDLYKRGIRCFMVEQGAHLDVADYDGACFIIVEDTLLALQRIAAAVRKTFAFPLIGITGSNGKTIVKEWVAQLFSGGKKVGRSPRSFNSQLGVPLSLLMLDEGCDLAIIEAGISLPGEMQKLQKCIKPEIGVITNIGQAHQENFTSLQQKLNEKLILFADSKVILYNSDQVDLSASINELYPLKEKLTVGKNQGASLRLLDQSFNDKGVELSVEWEEKSHLVNLPFADQISIDNALLSMLVALYVGISMDELMVKVNQLEPVAMRLEQKEAVNNCLLIDDAYNSDITSLDIALDFLNQLGTKQGLSKTLILSDIFQSGLSEQVLYKKVFQLAFEKGVERIIGIGPELYKAMHGRGAFKSTEEFLRQMNTNDFQNEAILLKGSRQFSFERISTLIEKKRHKTVLEINLNALIENVQFFKSKLKPKVKMLAMVKAFSYGSGSFEIANLLQHQKVDYLGVAFADEGIELREAGITLPIIVMNPEVSSFASMLQYDLEPEIYSFNILEAYANVVERQGQNGVPIHLKLDTGMNRLGFLPDEMEELVKRLKANATLKIASAFSHLAGSDEAVHDDFTKQQISTFKDVCALLEKQLAYPFLKHILNSAGIERFPEAQFDMVRLGIGMYGVSAEGNNLQQVGTLKSYVSQIKRVKADETIGYSRKGVLIDDSTIAIIPVGYADGLNRRLSNGIGQVIINNQVAPIIGNICMDMCMVDISAITAQEGDEVEIFGKLYTINDMAQALDTIPYEVLTSISRRVKRVYYME